MVGGKVRLSDRIVTDDSGWMCRTPERVRWNLPERSPQEYSQVLALDAIPQRVWIFSTKTQALWLTLMNGVNPDFASAIPYSKAYHYIGPVTLLERPKSAGRSWHAVRENFFTTGMNSLDRAEVFAFVRWVWNFDRFKLNWIERYCLRWLYFLILITSNTIP